MSGSHILDRGLTPEQAKADIDRRDRASWFPARHASGAAGIIAGRDGREVGRFDREQDRDVIVAMAKSHDAMRAALEAAQEFVAGEIERRGPTDADYDMIEQAQPLAKHIETALGLARGVQLLACQQRSAS